MGRVQPTEVAPGRHSAHLYPRLPSTTDVTRDLAFSLRRLYLMGIGNPSRRVGQVGQVTPLLFYMRNIHTQHLLIQRILMHIVNHTKCGREEGYKII